MRISRFFILGILGIQIFFSACSNMVIYEISKSQNFKLLPESKKTVTIVGCEDISLKEYVKLFNKKYSRKRDFVDDYISSLSNKLKSANTFSQIKFDLSPLWCSIKPYSNIRYNENVLDSLLNNCNTDYIINISDINVTNRIEYGRMNGGRALHMSITEFFMIQTSYQVIEVKSRKKILEFVSVGESAIFLFPCQSSLSAATRRSISNAITYLKTGKVNSYNNL
jgi:hypothetical protein